MVMRALFLNQQEMGFEFERQYKFITTEAWLIAILGLKQDPIGLIKEHLGIPRS